MYTKVWVIRCLCGLEYVFIKNTECNCVCGARLVREGDQCHAEVPDAYDLSSQPNKEPIIYMDKMPVGARHE